MDRKDKYSEHSSIIWPIWTNGWVFIYELSDPGFKSNCSHITQIVLRGIAVNAVVAHKEIITSVGSLQVSAGQEAENESIIYAMDAIFSGNSFEGVLLKDVSNAFNSINRNVFYT